jgi:hypothetical protein
MPKRRKEKKNKKFSIRLNMDLHKEMSSTENEIKGSKMECFVGSTGFEVRALHLLGRCFTAQVNMPVLFALAVLEIRSCFWPG